MSIQVQIFGSPKSNASKKAERFFKERNIKIHFIDLREKFMSKGEIGRFIQKFGLDALINTQSKSYQNQGLAYMRVSDEQMVEKLINDPELMVQPLVRSGQTLSIGWDDSFWKEWLKSNA